MRRPWRYGGTAGREAGPDGPRRRVVLLWTDLVAAFTAYVTGLLAAGLALGGDRARDVAVGNLAGAGLAVAAVAVLVLLRRRRGP
ncbi:hypothetical protein GCM10010420_55960 [Streptomyces glaucosporus]|uniref:Secreted protein n=1 Tax=Streptomyces glaucosporus TaxID=284044 RepID=A0ABN3IZG7_9ACTN